MEVVLNQFRVHITATDCLRNAKNVVFFLLCVLVVSLVGRIEPPRPIASGYATAKDIVFRPF